MYHSSNNTLKGNNLSDNFATGIFLKSLSNNNMLSGNIILNNGGGIFTDVSNNNTLINNDVLNNNYGILLEASSYNTLSGNNASNNLDGISMDNSGYNTIYNNFFNNINNNIAIKNIAFTNRWNITKIKNSYNIGGPYLGGNFWANPNGTGFSQICPDSDQDGICDSPYTLINNTRYGSNIDYLPLAIPPKLSPGFDINNTRYGSNIDYLTPAITPKLSPGFELALSIAALLALYLFGIKRI